MQLKKLLQKVKEKDKLADGLHLIDFEQLKIENQTLNEKKLGSFTTLECYIGEWSYVCVRVNQST